MSQKGVITVVSIILAVVIALSGVVYYSTNSKTNLVTGATPVPSAELEDASPVIPKIITQSSLTVLAAFGGIYVYWQFAVAPGRLRRKLKKLAPMLGEESSELLKEHYVEVYNLYMKLSEKHKQNFYSKVTKFREQIEEQLKAEKKIEELLQLSTKGSFAEQRKVYLEIYDTYLKLPVKVQQKYYSNIVHLRDQLERGK